MKRCGSRLLSHENAASPGGHSPLSTGLYTQKLHALAITTGVENSAFQEDPSVG